MFQVRSLLDTVNVRTDLKPARVLRAIRDGIRQASTDAQLIRSSEALSLAHGASEVNFTTAIKSVVGNEKKELVAFTGLQTRPANSHTDAYRDLGRPMPTFDFDQLRKGRTGTPMAWCQRGETIQVFPACSDATLTDFCDILVEYAWVPAFDDDFETVELGHAEISLIVPLIKHIILSIHPVVDNKQMQLAMSNLGMYERNISKLRSFSRTGKGAIANLTFTRYPGAP